MERAGVLFHLGTVLGEHSVQGVAARSQPESRSRSRQPPTPGLPLRAVFAEPSLPSDLGEIEKARRG